MYVVAPTKRVIDIISIYADLSGEVPAGDTITSVEVSVTVFTGADANPENLLYGVPDINGTTVSQRVKEGVPGNIYTVTYEATTSSDKVIVSDYRLAVLPNGVPADDIFTTYYRTSPIYPTLSVDGLNHRNSLISGKSYRVSFDGVDFGLALNTGSLYGALKSYQNGLPEGTDHSLIPGNGTLTVILINYTNYVDGADHALQIGNGTFTSYATISYTTGRPEGVDHVITLNGAVLI